MPPGGPIVAPGASYGLGLGSMPPDHAVGAVRGCGNGGAMETTDRFPQRLGNLAENARFPHSHKPILVPFGRRRTGHTDTVTGDR